MGYYSDGYSAKSHFITGVLCVTLGCFGVHRFYVGKYLSGIVYLLITLLIVPGFFLHFFIGCVLFGIIIFLIGTDFFTIYWNLFEDAKGFKVSPEGASAELEKEPLLPLILSGVITIGLLVASGFNKSFFGFALIFLVITFICLFKELKFLLKKDN